MAAQKVQALFKTCLTEIETMRTFTKSINRKFEDIENFSTNLSVNINSISTQENQNPLVAELK